MQRIEIAIQHLKSGPAYPSSPEYLELKFMRLHIHAATTKTDAFGFQSQALLNRRIAAQLDLATCPENPLPGQSERTV
jgi:hypothetical protein